MTIKVGFHLIPMFGDYTSMRKQWLQAEALGVDALYAADHFFPHGMSKEAAGEGSDSTARLQSVDGKNLEATTLQAAMAATTTKPEIGCIVHAVGFRNPNLLADIARTIDHISNGRFILGLGSGYLQKDYEDYGYEFGTARSRMLELKDSLPVIKARFDRLNPAPMRKIPILIGTMGEKIGMRIAAEHADIWHISGHDDVLAGKIELMKTYCDDIGRDFNEIEICTYYIPNLTGEEKDPDDFLKLGIRNIINVQYGPDWDLGCLKELIGWRETAIAKA